MFTIDTASKVQSSKFNDVTGGFSFNFSL